MGIPRQLTSWALAFAATASAAAGAGLAAGAGPHYLAVSDGAVVDEAGTVRSLGPFEYAFVSPHGAHYAIVATRPGVTPFKTTTRVYARDGRLRWTVNSGATAAFLGDDGAAVLITHLGVEPNSPSRLDFYSARGVKTGEARTAPPLDAAFARDGGAVAVTPLGGPAVVYDLAAGAPAYELAPARAVAFGTGGRVLLVSREEFAFSEDGRQLWTAAHDLYFPRLAVVNEAGTAALVGAHHEVALVALDDGRVTARWTAPDGFAVTDVAADADFTAVAVGMRSLAGVEAAVRLDRRLVEVGREDHAVAQPSGASPLVGVGGGATPAVMARGQGWTALWTE